VEVDGPGGPIRVYVKPQDFEVNGRRSVGCFDKRAGAIDISRDQSDVDMERTLFHELLHVVCHGVPAAQRAAAFGDDADASEEAFVAAIELPLHDLLKRNGWLTLPKPPGVRK
jgi:Zn-dependent peptidase ImmA (M78 family)